MAQSSVVYEVLANLSLPMEYAVRGGIHPLFIGLALLAPDPLKLPTIHLSDWPSCETIPAGLRLARVGLS